MVRDDDDQIVALASTVSDGTELNALYIESVWVDPVHRRRGVVRSLLKSLEHDAHMRGFRQLFLWVLDSNESARDTFVKLNYTFDGEMKPTRERNPSGVAIFEMRMVKPLLCQGSVCPCRSL